MTTYTHYVVVLSRTTRAGKRHLFHQPRFKRTHEQKKIRSTGSACLLDFDCLSSPLTSTALSKCRKRMVLMTSSIPSFVVKGSDSFWNISSILPRTVASGIVRHARTYKKNTKRHFPYKAATVASIEARQGKARQAGPARTKHIQETLTTSLVTLSSLCLCLCLCLHAYSHCSDRHY